MQNKSARIVVILIVAALLAAYAISRRQTATGSVSGTIEVDEAHLASRYGGRVEKILAQEGDTLHAGDVIVEMEASELRARRDSAAAQLAELEHGPRPAEIEAAKSDWEALKAQLEFAQDDAKRAEDLLKHKTISPSDREKAVSVANSLAKNVVSAQRRYDLLQEGTRVERIDQARAQLAEIDTQLREMRVYAPADCVLEVLSVKLGDVLAPNREVATVLLPQHLWVRVYVPEPWLGFIKVGQQVSVRVDSWHDRDFKGSVEQINRSAEFTPRNVQTVEDRIKQVFGVKIRLANEEDKLRAGMSADVVFPEVPK